MTDAERTAATAYANAACDEFTPSMHPHAAGRAVTGAMSKCVMCNEWQVKHWLLALLIETADAAADAEAAA